jgi:hypothetical protein
VDDLKQQSCGKPGSDLQLWKPDQVPRETGVGIVIVRRLVEGAAVGEEVMQFAVLGMVRRGLVVGTSYVLPVCRKLERRR